MKAISRYIAFLLLCWLVAASFPSVAAAQQYPDPRARVIMDNDFCGDPDGLFALAQQVLCDNVNIRGIVGAHLGADRMVRGDQAAVSVQKAENLLSAMGLTGRFPVVPGSSAKMTDPAVACDSQGAQLIIAEGRAASPQTPLYVCVGGPLTDVASALLLAPDIAPNLIVVWIGGQEYDFGHQKPWGGISEVEYNLNLDIPAARTVFAADVRMWQVPRDVYRQCLYSLASADLRIRALGDIGKCLMDELATWRRFRPGEAYVLGDNPLVLLSSLQSYFDPDTSSSDFVETEAPSITADGLYDFSRPGRKIRVYTRLDTAFMFKDMEDRLALRAAAL